MMGIASYLYANKDMYKVERGFREASAPSLFKPIFFCTMVGVLAACDTHNFLV